MRLNTPESETNLMTVKEITENLNDIRIVHYHQNIKRAQRSAYDLVTLRLSQIIKIIFVKFLY